MITEDSVNAVLREIQSRIPKEYLRAVVQSVPLTPTMQKITDEALADPNFPREKKEAIQALKDSGYFNKATVRTNPEMAKKIDNFVLREINKAVKEGRLPTKKQLKLLQEEWQKQKQKEKSSSN